MWQSLLCAPVTQRARVRSPVGTSYLDEVFSRFFLTCKTKCQQAFRPKGPRISSGHHSHHSPFITGANNLRYWRALKPQISYTNLFQIRVSDSKREKVCAVCPYLLFIFDYVETGSVVWSVESLSSNPAAWVRLPAGSGTLIYLLGLSVCSLSVFCSVLSLAVILSNYDHRFSLARLCHRVKCPGPQSGSPYRRMNHCRFGL